MKPKLYHIFKLNLEDTRNAGKIIKKLVYPEDDYGLHYDDAMKIRNEMQQGSINIYIIDTL